MLKYYIRRILYTIQENTQYIIPRGTLYTIQENTQHIIPRGTLYTNTRECTKTECDTLFLYTTLRGAYAV